MKRIKQDIDSKEKLDAALAPVAQLLKENKNDAANQMFHNVCCRVKGLKDYDAVMLWARLKKQVK